MQNKLLNKCSVIDFKKISFFVFLILYFIVLIYLCQRQYIWEDESYSLNTTSHNLSEVVRLSYHFEGQPPFYFLLLSIWRIFNSSIFFARLLSVIFIALSAFYFQRLNFLINGKSETKWLLVVFLLNPFTVWAALEIRLYALVIFLSITLLYYFYLFYKSQNNKYLFIFLGLSFMGLYTQYFFAFYIAALATSLWIFKGPKRFFKLCLYLIPVILLFLPNLFFFSNQLSIAQDYISSYSIYHTVADILRTPQDFILAFNIVPFNRAFRWAIKIVFSVAYFIVIIKFLKTKIASDKSKKDLIYFSFLVAIILIAFFIIFIPSLHLLYQEKYLIISFPIVILLLSIFKVLPTMKNFIFLLMSFYFIYLLALKYRYPVKTYDFKKVSIFINKIEQKNEPILFYGKSILPPFQYYYHGDNQLYGIPSIKYDKNYYKKSIRDTSEFIKSIEKIKSPANSYLVITESLGAFNTPAFTKKTIEKSIANHFNIIIDSSFKSEGSNNTLRVQKIVKKSIN